MGSSSNSRNDGSRLLTYTVHTPRCASIAIRDDIAVMRPSSSTAGSTVAPYRAEGFSVFLDKTEFKTRIGLIVD